MARRHVVVGATGSVAIGAVALCSRAGRARVRLAVRSAARRVHYQMGRLEGLRYRATGRRPDPSAGGPRLADRIRSVLGPLQRELDIPRVHVMAVDHDVVLHGDVASEEQARTLVDVVHAIPGVARVDSHLAVGFFRGETRPSEGRSHHPPSAALASVLAAAHGGGAATGTETAAAASVIGAFMSLLPPGERRHVLSHLPADLGPLARPSGRSRAARRPRHRAEFMAAALPLVAPDERETIVESVIGALRDLVPEEAVDIAAVLPSDLRTLWKVAVPL
jgi:uncharacterized protein (DUF2267 family)